MNPASALRQPKPPHPDVGHETLVALDGHGRLRPIGYELDDACGIELEHRTLKIRLARGARPHAAARLLIRRMYAGRGYRVPEGEHPANRVSLSVSDAERVVGTLTLGLDSEQGLAADALYRAELDSLRAQSRRLCEITQLAVDPAAPSRRVLFALFHIAYIHARRLEGATDAVIEVNPMHVRFYERALGFVRFGPERLCPRVQAPAVLLRLDFDYVQSQLLRFAGQPELAHHEKSLYPYAFSPIEEAGITQRLLRARA